ncbi:MAG: hypothetical protein CL489_06435 [Acidobacteria bacterium]|nr:hypothetical protein [Acidobacteriota bacterium]|tara:strand:+ start:62066 stop:62539 length:474 start_codon:yes stop_codon:yes gene_type:complete
MAEVSIITKVEHPEVASLIQFMYDVELTSGDIFRYVNQKGNSGLVLAETQHPFDLVGGAALFRRLSGKIFVDYFSVKPEKSPIPLLHGLKRLLNRNRNTIIILVPETNLKLLNALKGQGFIAKSLEVKYFGHRDAIHMEYNKLFSPKQRRSSVNVSR